MRKILPARLVLFLIALGALQFLAKPQLVLGDVKPQPVLEKTKINPEYTLNFDVLRKGDKVGFHNVQFSQNGSDLVVESIFKIEIDFLIFTAFRFEYQCTSFWENGTLTALEAETNDDGTISIIKMSRKGNTLYIKNSNGAYTLESPLFPTNHWNPDVLSQTRVLNTLTGRINDVKIEFLKEDIVTTENGRIKAKHFRYTGDLDTEVWYDSQNRWVKMRFKAKDDSIIEYRCTRCQGQKIVN